MFGKKNVKIIIDIIPPSKKPLLKFLKRIKCHKHYKLILPAFIGVLAAVFLSIVFYNYETKAEVAKFYPTACLGGWLNPQNSQGEPQVGEGASPEEFNESNSATLQNAISELYCGGFQGEAPESAEIKRILLKFSWLIKEEGLESEIQNLEEEEKATTTDESLFGIELPVIIQEATTSEEAAVTEEAITTEENQLESIPESIPENIPNLPPENNSPPAEENLLPPEETPESQPTSLWQKFVFTAHAQEATTSEEMIPVSTPLTEPLQEEISIESQEETSPTSTPPTEPLQEETSSAPMLEPLPEPLPEIIQESEETSSTSAESLNNLIEEATSTEEVMVELDDSFFEILYSVDGVNWQSLGKINRDNWQNLVLEMPNFNWDDLAKIQIALKSPAVGHTVFSAYLDALWLEIEYEKIERQEEIPAENSSGPEPDFITGMIRQDVSEENLRAIIIERGGMLELWYGFSASTTNPDLFTWTFLTGEGQIDTFSPLGLHSGTVFWIDKNKQMIYGFKVNEQSLSGGSLVNSEKDEKSGHPVVNIEDIQVFFNEEENKFYFKN